MYISYIFVVKTKTTKWQRANKYKVLFFFSLCCCNEFISHWYRLYHQFKAFKLVHFYTKMLREKTKKIQRFYAHVAIPCFSMNRKINAFFFILVDGICFRFRLSRKMNAKNGLEWTKSKTKSQYLDMYILTQHFQIVSFFYIFWFFSRLENVSHSFDLIKYIQRELV